MGIDDVMNIFRDYQDIADDEEEGQSILIFEDLVKHQSDDWTKWKQQVHSRGTSMNLAVMQEQLR